MILGLIQARMSSTRLPKKVMRLIGGEPMLFRQIERLRDSKRVDQWAVVTSTDPTDAELVSECTKRGCQVFAGSLEDVLDRYYKAALAIRPSQVVRVTGDCPIIDPEIIDDLIDFHMAGGFEYSSNALEPTFPDGLDCEIINWSVLEQAWKEAKLPSEREHVTPFIYKDFKTAPKFKIGSYKSQINYSHFRWTVDEVRDFELITEIFENLYTHNPKFRTGDVLELLKKKPALASLNSSIERNEGYKRSLAKDPKQKV